jgi:hypothetical protein
MFIQNMANSYVVWVLEGPVKRCRIVRRRRERRNNIVTIVFVLTLALRSTGQRDASWTAQLMGFVMKLFMPPRVELTSDTQGLELRDNMVEDVKQLFLLSSNRSLFLIQFSFPCHTEVPLKNNSFKILMVSSGEMTECPVTLLSL